jgi:O-6-methylguanine DNA methyltransferase
MPIKLKNNENFRTRVENVVRAIPKGETKSYAEVADLAGSPKAYRAVASIMAKNYDPDIPCHRVIRSDEKIGDYNRGGEKTKLKILKAEGWKG